MSQSVKSKTKIKTVSAKERLQVYSKDPKKTPLKGQQQFIFDIKSR